MKMNFTLKRVFSELPEKKEFIEGIRRAPKRTVQLSDQDIELALTNALRYIPAEWQEELAPEFLDELLTKGRIYGYRFRPKGNIKAKPVNEYVGNTLEGKSFQLMIDNNLDFDIALYPYELVTYGETGQVCQNWMQYHLIKLYLEEMNDNQTLHVLSGHPLGLYRSKKHAPRVVVSNGLMIGAFDDLNNFNRAAALGVANYGQMTAGGWMYIGPQGIVHGTYSTLLNAGRTKLSIPFDEDLKGTLFVSSGLGGMSGAQGKAAKIAGGVSIIAEVDESRVETRYSQNWIDVVAKTPEMAFKKAQKAIDELNNLAIGYLGNVVDLLEYAADNNIHIDLLSDQTSCHNVYEGGYTPQGVTFEERTELLKNNKDEFTRLVNIGLQKHYQVINRLTENGTYFFDYGNSFLKAVYDTGIKEICRNGLNDLDGFIYPSYVEDIMGPVLFDYGYGPFRWVCLSLDKEDLRKTDLAAMDVIDPNRRFQDLDNYNWIKNAEENNLVVGSQARILYQDAYGRLNIALRFNEMIRNGEVGPIMLGRDHHDTGGTDSPFRETSNIKDGSNIMADMATQVYAGNAARGMSLIALHNGGGVGISKSVNGGYGMVLDGSKLVDEILKDSLLWDVMCGVGRRNWARNENAVSTVKEFNDISNNSYITVPEKLSIKNLSKLIDGKK